MSALKSIYRAAGWWNEHWGRVKTLAWWLIVASAASFVGGGFLIRRYGLIGGIAIVFGITLLIAAIAAFVIDRHIGRAVQLQESKSQQDITATFTFTGEHLQLGLRNGGLSMRDAGVNLLVPSSLGFISRVGRDGHRADTGVQSTTTEELIPGQPSLYWAETRLQFQGGGQTTLLRFLTGHPPGIYPVKLKLYDDSTGTPRSFTTEDSFTIPSLEQPKATERHESSDSAPPQLAITPAMRAQAAQIVEAARGDIDRRAEITARDRLVPKLRYTLDSPPTLIVSIENRGSTIHDAKLNLFAAMRAERQWVFRLTGSGGPATSGSTSEIDHPTLPGYPKSLRWDEAPITLLGYSTTELKFFFPRFAGDPIHLRIGSDDLMGWLEWVFVTPGDDETVLTMSSEPQRSPERSPERTGRSETPDPAQLRRALDRASAKLRNQRDLIWEWRLHEHLDPNDRGEWETEDRKGILHQDPRFREAFHATEDAFNAISLMKDPTSYHRDLALGKIDQALRALDAASELVSD